MFLGSKSGGVEVVDMVAFRKREGDIAGGESNKLQASLERR